MYKVLKWFKLWKSSVLFEKSQFRAMYDWILCGTSCTTMYIKIIVYISRIESVSSRQADPCSSFYEAACGGWVGSRNITRPMDTISVLDQLKLDIDKNIRGKKKNPQIIQIPCSVFMSIKLRRLFYSSFFKLQVTSKQREPVYWQLLSVSMFMCIHKI